MTMSGTFFKRFSSIASLALFLATMSVGCSTPHDNNGLTKGTWKGDWRAAVSSEVAPHHVSKNAVVGHNNCANTKAEPVCESSTHTPFFHWRAEHTCVDTSLQEAGA